jgi:cystathionine beta-lyase
MDAASDGQWNFDAVIDRQPVAFPDSLKWNRYADRDVIPLWVADMDFAAPPAVIAALRERVAHGVFGYGQPWPTLTATVLDYLDRQYHWRIEAEWLVWLPGLVTGLNVACRAVNGDVITATPVYPPFLSAPTLSGRRVATVPLARSDDRWGWDFDALAEAVTPATRLLLLCHPHNPVGRAWDDQELQTLAELAERHDLIVCSDEIHCDLVLSRRQRHRPFATLGKSASRRSVTLMAPSKTFNVPGLGCAFAVIPDTGLRREFQRAMSGIVPHVNTLGLVACEAALRDGGSWHAALIDYLRGNRERVAIEVAAMPGLRMTRVEATYLAWIDTSASGIGDPQRFFEAAGVGLSGGGDFGRDGDYRQFVRLNFGCPRSTLDTALTRMRNGMNKLSQSISWMASPGA